MDLRIAPHDASLVEATYLGTASINERYQAKDEIARAAGAAGVNRILIDLTHAAIEEYGVADALRVVGKVEALSSFGHVAYVVRPGYPDLVASILQRSYGPQYFRIYGDRQDAVDWLSA